MYGIGVQLFGFTKEMATDPKATIKAICEIGLDAIEIAVMFEDAQGRVKKQVEKITAHFGGPLPKTVWHYAEAQDYIRFAQSLGLKVTSCHIFFADAYPGLLTDIKPQLLKLAADYGIQQFVFSMMLKDQSGCDAVRDDLNTAVDYLAAIGVHAAYHSHEMELINHVGAQTVLDYLLSQCDPRLKLQYDIGWGHYADRGVVAFIERYKNRIVSLHLKDLIPGACAANRQNSFVAIGTGDVPTAAALARVADLPLIDCGIIMDQDNSPTSMLADLATGLQNIKAMLPKEN